MPPEVVGEVLRAAVDLPSPEGLEGLVIHHEDAPRTLAVGRAERAHVEGIGAAVAGVRSGVAGPAGDLVRFDDLHNLGVDGILLGVQDVALEDRRPGTTR
jgi:hypothetical protein